MGATNGFCPTNYVSIDNIYHSVCTNTYGLVFEGLVETNAPYDSIIGSEITYNSGTKVQGSDGTDLVGMDPQWVSTNLNTVDLHLTSESPGIGPFSRPDHGHCLRSLRQCRARRRCRLLHGWLGHSRRSRRRRSRWH